MSPNTLISILSGFQSKHSNQILELKVPACFGDFKHYEPTDMKSYLLLWNGVKCLSYIVIILSIVIDFHA